MVECDFENHASVITQSGLLACWLRMLLKFNSIRNQLRLTRKTVPPEIFIAFI